MNSSVPMIVAKMPCSPARSHASAGVLGALRNAVAKLSQNEFMPKV